MAMEKSPETKPNTVIATHTHYLHTHQLCRATEAIQQKAHPVLQGRISRKPRISL